jgi:hypothetical protein
MRDQRFVVRDVAGSPPPQRKGDWRVLMIWDLVCNRAVYRSKKLRAMNIGNPYVMMYHAVGRTCTALNDMPLAMLALEVSKDRRGMRKYIRELVQEALERLE